MIQYGYKPPGEDVVWCKTRGQAEKMCKVMGYTMYERDVSEPRVSSIRA